MMRSCLRRSPRYASGNSCSLVLFFVCLFAFNYFLSSLFLIFVTILMKLTFHCPPPPQKKNNKSNNNNNDNNNSDSNNSERDVWSQIRVLPHLFREGNCLPSLPIKRATFFVKLVLKQCCNDARFTTE